jgi:hypothetical protein
LHLVPLGYIQILNNLAHNILFAIFNVADGNLRVEGSYFLWSQEKVLKVSKLNTENKLNRFE